MPDSPTTFDPAPERDPRGDDATGRDDPLAPLAGAAADAAVVGIGEASHGAREVDRVRDRLVRRLVVDAGVRTLALEAPPPAALAADAFVRGADGDGGGRDSGGGGDIDDDRDPADAVGPTSAARPIGGERADAGGEGDDGDDRADPRPQPTSPARGDRGTMYEAVHAHPEGEATAARLVATAARHGYDGVVVRSRDADYDPEALAAAYGPDVAVGIEVDAEDRASAAGAVGNFRPDCEVLLVAGGEGLNRFAAESDRVDVLARPTARDGEVGAPVAKAARDHEVAIEFDLGPALRRSGGARVRALRELRKLREVVGHYEPPHVVSATPRSHLALRAPRELVALGEQLGFDPEFVRAGLAEWGEIAERTRRRRSDSFISPGVERLDDDP